HPELLGERLYHFRDRTWNGFRGFHVFEVKLSDEEELMENLRKQQDLGAVFFGGIPDELLRLGQILRATPRTVHLQQSDSDFHPYISLALAETSRALSRGRGLGHVDRGHQI